MARSRTVIEGECEVLAAAGGEPEDGLVGESVLFDQVEEVLEQARSHAQ